MFEHFNRHDAVKQARRTILVRRRGEDVGIGGDDHVAIAEPAAARLLLNKLALRRTVGNAEDLHFGVGLEQIKGQRAPAATQVEHRMAVLHARALARELEHRGLFGVNVQGKWAKYFHSDA